MLSCPSSGYNILVNAKMRWKTSTDQDEMAHYELSHLNLTCLQTNFSFLTV